MGCKVIKEAGKSYFIPDCWEGVIKGKGFCTCHDWKRRKLSDAELIQELRKENEELRARLQKEKI